MTKIFSPREMVRQSYQIARDYNLRIFEKAGRYNVYRIVEGKAVFLGAKGSPKALHDFVSSAAGSSNKGKAMTNAKTSQLDKIVEWAQKQPGEFFLHDAVSQGVGIKETDISRDLLTRAGVVLRKNGFLKQKDRGVYMKKTPIQDSFHPPPPRQSPSLTAAQPVETHPETLHSRGQYPRPDFADRPPAAQHLSGLQAPSQAAGSPLL